MNDPPTNIILSNDRITLKQPIGSVVANLSATDSDLNEIQEFSLVSGQGDSDNGFFNILDKKLLIGKEIVDKSKMTYHIRIQVKDKDNLTNQ